MSDQKFGEQEVREDEVTFEKFTGVLSEQTFQEMLDTLCSAHLLEHCDTIVDQLATAKMHVDDIESGLKFLQASQEIIHQFTVNDSDQRKEIDLMLHMYEEGIKVAMRNAYGK